MESNCYVERFVGWGYYTELLLTGTRLRGWATYTITDSLKGFSYVVKYRLPKPTNVCVFLDRRHSNSTIYRQVYIPCSALL